MSIAFSCPDCGKSFKVPDDMAGRKAKCSGCSAMVEIPNTVGISERPSSRSSGPALKEADDWQDEEVPRKKRAAQQIEDEEEESDEPVRRRRPKKRKQKKSSGVFVFVLVGIGLVTLVGMAAVAAGFVWYFGFSDPDPLKFAPDNAKVVMVFNMEQVEGTRSWDAINKESETLNNQNQMGFTGQSPTFKKARVTQMWILSSGSVSAFPGGLNPIGGGPGSQEQDVIVVKTKDSLSVDDLRNDPNLKGPFTESKVGSYTLYQGTPLSFCRVSSKFILLGPSASLNKVLTRDKQPELSDNLKAAMKQADFSKPFALAIDNPGGTFGANSRDLAPLEMQWLAVQGTFGSDIDMTLMVQSQSDRGAQEVKKKADELVKTLKAGFDMAGALGQKLPKFYDEPRFSLNGSMFTAQITFKTDGVIELMRLGKKGAGNVPPAGQPGRGGPRR
jgi:hypothetical protein